MLLYPQILVGNGSSTLITSTQSQQSDAVSKFCHFGIAAATIQIKSKKECAAAIEKKEDYGFGQDLKGGLADGNSSVRIGFYAREHHQNGPLLQCKVYF